MSEEVYAVKVRIRGRQDILFHRWSEEEVDAKSKAPRGSEVKRRDNLESYVYRNEEGYICIPARYLIRSIVEAGRNFNDPRSAKKQAKELVQAAVMCDEILSPILVNGEPVKTWDYEDHQRVCIMRRAITRIRPAFKKGWEGDFTLISLVPELITPDFLRKLVDNAGLLGGLGDMRPTYGRYRVTNWEIVPYEGEED